MTSGCVFLSQALRSQYCAGRFACLFESKKRYEMQVPADSN